MWRLVPTIVLGGCIAGAGPVIAYRVSVGWEANVGSVYAALEGGQSIPIGPSPYSAYVGNVSPAFAGSRTRTKSSSRGPPT